jgi:topoisomerase-4 subunit B
MLEQQAAHSYTEDNIRSLDWKEHIRMRPGMYIGKLGDGQSADDGIYVLLKEVVDNSIDEHAMGHGKAIRIAVRDGEVKVRDFGRGIPLGKVIDCVSKINTGGKYDSRAFQKSVGLNGVGTKAVNALSESFTVESFRDGQAKRADFHQGNLLEDHPLEATEERNGTQITFRPDTSVFRGYRYRTEFVEKLLWNYAYLNTGLTLYLNGEKYKSEEGLKDLLSSELDGSERYPVIHLKGERKGGRTRGLSARLMFGSSGNFSGRTSMRPTCAVASRQPSRFGWRSRFSSRRQKPSSVPRRWGRVVPRSRVSFSTS